MDETQRKEYEYNQRLQQLEQKEHDFAVAQNKLEATKILASRDLPIEFVDYIVADDAETMLENINTFEKLEHFLQIKLTMRILSLFLTLFLALLPDSVSYVNTTSYGQEVCFEKLWLSACMLQLLWI